MLGIKNLKIKVEILHDKINNLNSRVEILEFKLNNPPKYSPGFEFCDRKIIEFELINRGYDLRHSSYIFEYNYSVYNFDLNRIEFLRESKIDEIIKNNNKN